MRVVTMINLGYPICVYVQIEAICNSEMIQNYTIYINVGIIFHPKPSEPTWPNHAC